jgi:hypothetical protein
LEAGAGAGAACLTVLGAEVVVVVFLGAVDEPVVVFEGAAVTF